MAPQKSKNVCGKKELTADPDLYIPSDVTMSLNCQVGLRITGSKKRSLRAKGTVSDFLIIIVVFKFFSRCKIFFKAT